MRIGIYHGYELIGSGSNEYTRYISRALALLGHEVHVFCREPEPEVIPHLSRAFAWDSVGTPRELFLRTLDSTCVVHQLPHGEIRPVYITDQPRKGRVKPFTALSDAELDDFHSFSLATLRAALDAYPVDVLHANHLVYQPSVAVQTGCPTVIFLHGSSIEYTVKRDERFLEAGRTALRQAAGVISGNREVLERLMTLYPEERELIAGKSAIVGVGVDTSLFQPVERRHRRETLARMQGTYEGKPPQLGAELRQRLDEGDFSAVTAYRRAYEHAQPDADLVAHIARIPWEEGKILLFAGALTAGKGLQGVIAAMPNVLRHHPDAHLVAVGAGAYREVLEALVHALATGNQALFEFLVEGGFDLDHSELSGRWEDVRGPFEAAPGLTDHVHFLGRIDHHLLRHVFPCADLTVFPSIIPEAYGLVLMESLSNGVLPLVSDFSGFRDALQTLEDLLDPKLVDRMRLPVDPRVRIAGIAMRINSMFDEPEPPAQGARLRQIAVQHFDWNVCAQALTQAYERFAGSRSEPAADGSSIRP